MLWASQLIHLTSFLLWVGYVFLCWAYCPLNFVLGTHFSLYTCWCSRLYSFWCWCSAYVCFWIVPRWPPGPPTHTPPPLLSPLITSNQPHNSPPSTNTSPNISKRSSLFPSSCWLSPWLLEWRLWVDIGIENRRWIEAIRRGRCSEWCVIFRKASHKLTKRWKSRFKSAKCISKSIHNWIRYKKKLTLRNNSF